MCSGKAFDVSVSRRDFLTRISGTLIGIFGAMYTARGSTRAAVHLSSQEHTHVIGNMLCVAQVVCIAFYLILLKRVSPQILRRYPLWTTCCIVSFGALLTLSIFVFATILVPPELWVSGNRFVFDTPFFLEVAFAVIFATVQNYLIRTIAIKMLSPTEIGMYLTMNPPLTALGAYLFLGEQVTSAEMVGCILVALGLTLYSYTDIQKMRLNHGTPSKRSRFDTLGRNRSLDEPGDLSVTKPLLDDENDTGR